MPHPAVLDLLQFDIIWRLLISLPQLAYGSLQWRCRGCQTVLSKQGRWYSDFTIDWVKLRPVDWRSCAEQALLTVRPLQKQLESRLQAQDAGKIAAIAHDWEIVLALYDITASTFVSPFFTVLNPHVWSSSTIEGLRRHDLWTPYIWGQRTSGSSSSASSTKSQPRQMVPFETLIGWCFRCLTGGLSKCLTGRLSLLTTFTLDITRHARMSLT